MPKFTRSEADEEVEYLWSEGGGGGIRGYGGGGGACGRGGGGEEGVDEEEKMEEVEGVFMFSPPGLLKCSYE